MYTLKKLVTLALLCLYSVPAVYSAINEINYIEAVSTEITGKVIASDTGEPLAGAHIHLSDRDAVLISDKDGVFTFQTEYDTEELRVRITFLGFQPYSAKLPVSELDPDSVITFRIKPFSESLSPVTVLAHRAIQTPSNRMDTENTAFLPVDSGAFIRNAGNASGIRKGGFGIDPVIRGLSGSRLNVRLDGLSATAAACPNRMDPPTSHIRLSDIERVEIFRGPHALEFGPSFGGTVNFVSHETPDYNEFSLNGDYRAGMESNTGHKKMDLRLLGGSQLWDFLISGGMSSSGSYSAGNDISVPAGFESYDIGLEAGVNLNESNRLTSGWSQSFIRDADFPALGMDMAVDDTYKFKAGYEWSPVRKEYLSSFKLNGYWSLVDHEMNNHRRSSFEMRDAVALAETETYGLQAKLKGLYSSGTYTLAGSLDHQSVEGTRFIDIKTGPSAGQSMAYNLWQDSHVLNIGIYAGAEHFTGKWNLSIGARTDYNRAEANDPAPRFIGINSESEYLNISISGGVSRSFGSATEAGFYVGRGVRSPDITERFINYLTIGRDGFEYAGTPDLKPEANTQADLILSSDFGSFRIETNLFVSFMTNYISAVVNPEINPVGMNAPGVREFQNRGNAFFTGFEFTAGYSVTPSWSVQLNSSYTRAEYTDDESPVAEIPPFESSFSLTGVVFPGILTQETTFRKVFSQNRFDQSFGETETPGFLVLDINLNSSEYRGISISGGVRNLLNESYYEHLNRQFNPGINPSGDYLFEPGRRFFIEISARY